MDVQASVRLMYAGVLLIVGLAMGSFLNVAAYRLPLGMSLLHPPSMCPACGTAISARDNVPLLGWLMLGGKCRSCRKPISPRYPAVELIAGLLWAAEGWRLAGSVRGLSVNVAIGLMELAFLSSLVVTFLVDWDHRIILDEISVGGTIAALAASPFLPALHHAETDASFALHFPFLDYFLGAATPWLRSLSASLAGAAAGLLFSLLIYALGNAAFKNRIAAAREEDPEVDSALGIGDVKLMVFFGAFLGWQAVFLIFIVGSLIGSVAGALMKYGSGSAAGAVGWQGMKNRWRSGNSVVPFGPFLSMGALAAFFSDTPLNQMAARWPFF